MRKTDAFRAIASSLVLAVSSLVPFLALPAHTASAAALPPAYRYTDVPIQTGGFVAAGHVSTDTQGNVYVAGVFNGTVNFAGSLGNDTITSNDYDTYVTKYNADNTYGWTKIFDTATNNGSAQADAIAIDAAGNVYTAGSFSGTVIFDGPGGSDQVASNGNGGSAFLTEYTASGAYVGTKIIMAQFGQNATTYGLAIDKAGQIVLAGSFSGTVDFDPGSGTDNHTDVGGNGNTFVSVYNADGSYAWTHTFDTTAGGGAGDVGLAVDSAGNVYLTGWLYGTVNFDEAGTDNKTDGGNGTSFITKFNSTGSYGWTRLFDYSGGSSYTYPTSISVDGNGNIYAAGMFSGTVNFDGSGGTDNQTDVGGSGNGYLAKYAADGSYAWTKIFDTSPGGGGYVAAVANDMNGDIYALSSFNGSVNFAGSSGTDVQDQPNGGALTMYNPDGSYAWTRVFDTTTGPGTAVTTQGIVAAVAADRLGNVFVASQFTGTVTFDGPGGTDTQTASSQNGFLTSFRTFIPGQTTGNNGGGSGAQAAAQLTNTGLAVATISVIAAALMLGAIAIRAWRPAV